MDQKKLLTKIMVLLIWTIVQVNAQTNYELLLRTNLGIGSDYESLKFSNINGSGDLLFSPGGGMGVELGLGCLILNKLNIYSTIGYQQNLAIQYSSSSFAGTDKTAFTFSRSMISLGGNYRFKFKKESKFSAQIGGGGSYNIPGKMSITELNFDYGNVTFHSAFSHHIELGMLYDFGTWSVGGSIRLRRLKFKLKEYNQPTNTTSFVTYTYTQFPDYIKNINANGVDLSITLVKKISTK